MLLHPRCFMNNRTKSYKNLIFSALGQVITIAIGLLLRVDKENRMLMRGGQV